MGLSGDHSWLGRAVVLAVLTGVVGVVGAEGELVLAHHGGRSVGLAEPAPLRLRADQGGTSSLTVPLRTTPVPAHAGLARTPMLSTTAFTMAAVTWTGSRHDVDVRLRVRGRQATGAWRTLPVLDDGPDAGTAEAHPGRSATDLQWVGTATGAQVEVRGTPPSGLRLVLIGSQPTAADRRSVAVAARSVVADGRRRHHRKRPHRRPRLYSRKVWHADPALRTGPRVYLRTIQQVHIHHTDNANDYSRAEVPALLRGIYAYHTQTLGWSDIGYNFLVDRFGRIWVGRAGSADHAVRGAHTLGFNSTSVGVAVIGDFQVAQPSRAVVRALVRLAAWKLARYHRHPLGHAHVYSHGSDLYPAGETVRLPVIDGHRDTNRTACPGIHLYRLLPEIRRRAAHRMHRFAPPHRHHQHHHHQHHHHP